MGHLSIGMKVENWILRLNSKAKILYPRIGCNPNIWILNWASRFYFYASKMHHKIGNPICNHCGHHFENKFKLQEHIRYVHQKIKDYLSDQCGKSYGRKEHFSAHKKLIHDQSQKHKCDQCNNRFLSSSALLQHQKSCSSEN